jgi:hypothetical protein
MERSNRNNRAYATTTLPTLREGSDLADKENRDLMIKIYDQVCSTWKELIGVRFKLLGLVPAVSLALLSNVFSNASNQGLPTFAKLLICVVGLFVVIGLFIYDRRNSALHDDLISRGRKIEDELGIDTGIFRGRLKAEGIFKHDVATNLVYALSSLAWLLAILAIGLLEVIC